MMRTMRQLTILLLVAGNLLLNPAQATEHDLSSLGNLSSLKKAGTTLRLQGDFDAAKVIEAELIAGFDEPVGHVFALNTIVTHLTWDEKQTQYDDALLDHVAKTMSWCEQRLEQDATDVKANYYCGQASFAHSYYNGLRGSYYQAGKQGTASIKYLEAALAQDPTLIDAKMHLGISYFVADNLPPFIRMFSRFLWFIPSGNSEKSLPYLREAIEDGEYYRDVARYIYSVVLLEDPTLRTDAERQLRKLVELYPSNTRFQLRLISVLLMQEDFDGTLLVANNYLQDNERLQEPDLSLAKVWMVRAYLGLKRVEDAHKTFSETWQVFATQSEELPGWSVAWHKLTDGQLHDLANRRHEALATYRDILDLAKSTYVNDVILEAAQRGISTPYSLTTQ